MFATIRFPARIGRINYRTSSRMINATETEGASGQSIVRSGTRSRARSPMNKRRPGEGIFLLTAAFCTRVHRRRILTVWQIRFSVSPINHPQSSSFLFEPPQFYPFAPFTTSPRYHKYSVIFLSFSLSAGYTEDLVQATTSRSVSDDR